MKFTVLTLIISVPLLVFAQKSKPPMVVMQTMLAKYPDAKKIKWEEEADGVWESSFVWEGIEYEVEYDKAGNRLVTERELTESEIPEKYISALSKDYPDYEIKEAWWIESAEGIIYEFELKGKSGEVEVLMDSNCVVIPDEDDDDEKD